MSQNTLTQTEVSLNPPSADLVTVKINGVELKVPKGENVIESAKRANIDVPYFCYHPRLSKGDAANCRMCLVDVFMPRKNPDGTEVLAKMPKPQTACTLPAAEGMVIETESEQVVQDRRGILEFLLINHPLDCPICDRGGECPLQNNTLHYGPPMSRYIEEKRHFPKAYPLSEHVVFDRERCIHCARCTRFTEDISGDVQLGFLKRGADMEVGTYAQTKFQSKFSGNVIELCPVGALLSRSYRFKARPWDLHSQKSICSQCSNGCNIKIDYRLDALQRVNARVNEDVNEEWTCDRGKFGHDYVSSPERLRKPRVKIEGAWQEIEWAQAYRLLVDRLQAAGGSVGGIGGAHCTNEDNYAFQRLFREVLKSNHLDSRIGRYQGPTNAPLYDRLGYHTMGNAIADLEQMKTLFVVGADLEDEQPILFLRVRKAARFKGTTVLSAVDHVNEGTTRVGDFAALEMVYKRGSEIALLKGLLHVLVTEKLVTAPESVEMTAIRQSVAEWTPEKTSQATGVPTEQIVTAAKRLINGPMAIVAGKTVTEHLEFEKIAEALSDLVIATGNAGNLNIPVSEVNAQGAMDLGILPDRGPGYASLDAPGMNTQQMLEAAAQRRLDVLWIVGAKLVESHRDPGLVRRALENCPLVVVNELFMTETAQLADLVLPVASFAEKDGTFTNCEGRVQRIHKAFEISPDIKPDWLVFTEVTAQLGGGAPYFSPRDIFRAITANVPLYQGLTLQGLGESGSRRAYPPFERPTAAPAPVAEAAPVIEASPTAVTAPPAEAAPPTEAAPTAQGVHIVGIEFSQTSNKRPDEGVVIQNGTSETVNLKNWTLRDLAKHIYKFPDFSLAPGAKVTVWTRTGKNDAANLYWGSKTPIWNNTGDTGILCDSQDNEISRYSYGNKQ